MPPVGRMHLTIDFDRYLLLPPDIKARFDGWLRAEHLADKKIVELTLAEGYVTVERYATDDTGRIIVNGGHLVVERREYPITTLPPADAFRSASSPHPGDEKRGS